MTEALLFGAVLALLFDTIVDYALTRWGSA
jgi:hypothetical protein